MEREPKIFFHAANALDRFSKERRDKAYTE